MQISKPKLFLLFNCVFFTNSLHDDQFCSSVDEKCNDNTKSRYIFYDVNPPEGFNLRRDVYMRYAVWAHNLRKSALGIFKDVKLVLPPWSHLYHWTYSPEPEHVPWSYYFDLSSLRKFAPVIDMHQFFDEIGVRYSKIKIDKVYILQHYDDMFKTGNFVEKMSIEECNEPIRTNFFYFDNITSNDMKCLSFHGFTSQLTKILEDTDARTILFDHAEVALHDNFGDRIYWKCRRSMRFNKELINVAFDFRAKYLNSIDENDKTDLPDDWTSERPRRNALGGPYLSVHMRRADFVRSRPKEVPSIKNAAVQIKRKLDELRLTKVFVASDGSDEEMNELRANLGTKYELFLYKPDEYVMEKYKSGGVAIVEQIICSYARYFMGSYESTFSFRIQEEREILGFPVGTTFNRLCGDKENECEKPTQWKIVY